jgi:hypothetical protein
LRFEKFSDSSRSLTAVSKNLPILGDFPRIRYLTVQSVNNTDKDINQPLNLLHDCCEMTVDALPLGEIKLETQRKSIPTLDGD